MERMKKVLLWCYALTAFCLVGYFIHLCFTIEESASIGLLFVPFFLFILFIGIAWAETLVVGILFFRHARALPKPLLAGFFIAGSCYAILLFAWSRPEGHAEIPAAGELHVEVAVYKEHQDTLARLYIITNDYLKIDLYEYDTVAFVRTDTIIYSPDGDTLLSFIIISGQSEGHPRYSNGTIAGIKTLQGWRYFVPKGNTRRTGADSPEKLRMVILQHYYDRYSVNGSDPDKPDIWKDEFIFTPNLWSLP